VLVTAWAAVAVTVAGLALAVALRPDRAASDPTNTPLTSADSPDPGGQPQCGAGPCQPVATQRVGADAVELLAGVGTGRVQVTSAVGTSVFEVSITQSGAQLTADSLDCLAGAVSTCLVRGATASGVQGEVLVGQHGTWSRAQVGYLASGGYLALHDVNGDGVADVVAVQRACRSDSGCEQVFGQVFVVDAGSTPLGCTRVFPSLAQVPGYPEVALSQADLHPCPAG
jgi:hypothetical protein